MDATTLAPENERYLRGWGCHRRAEDEGWVRPRGRCQRALHIPAEVARGPLETLKRYVAAQFAMPPRR
ncbi:MAG: hypothetical protein SF182_14000 [Deltaproteobacteria bacterium]|nr:hypothetical protein [Deltaproteobacteria bacterium]